MRILLAVHDWKFSAASANALITQVKPEGTEIRILYVLEEFPQALAEKLGSNTFPDFTRARIELRNEAKEFLERTQEMLRSAGFDVSCLLLEDGEPQEIILDEAERWPADVIFVGSHGRKGIRRFLMGSTAEAVARYARCSVQILRIRPEH
ncbi:MAG: universal stress protein [Candidatus Acidiferrum sp.]